MKVRIDRRCLHNVELACKHLEAVYSQAAISWQQSAFLLSKLYPFGI